MTLKAYHDSLSEALTLTRPSPTHWSMSFAPTMGRRFKTAGFLYGLFIIAIVLFSIIVGTSMVFWPIEAGVDEDSVLEYGIYGVIGVGFGLWVLIGQYSRHLRASSTHLELEDGTFFLDSTEIKGEISGRISSLQARLTGSTEDEFHARLHLDWDDGNHVVQGLTLDEMDRLQEFFADAGILLSP